MDSLSFLQVPIGILSGWIALVVTRSSLKKRQPDLVNPWWLTSAWTTYTLWGFVGLLLVSLAAFRSASTALTIIRSVWFLSLLSLSAVDQIIRKIPNEALFLMMIAKVAELIINKDLSPVPDALIGLVAGYFFFSIPALLGRSIGKGDVKLAAAIGFCTGVTGVLQSIVIMSLGIVIYYSLKLKQKRSNLKTKVAMGPYLSMGMVVSVLWPISNPFI